MKRLLPIVGPRSGYCAVLALLLAVVVGCGQKTVPHAVRFDFDVEVVAGAPVRLGDVVIGRVSVVRRRSDETIAYVEISEEYADRVTLRSDFVLRRESLASSSRYLELISRDGPTAPPQSEFEGRVGLADAVAQLIEGFREAIEDPELRREAEELGRRMQDVAREGRESWDRLRPELELEAEALLREAERRGAGAADAVRRELERLKEEWEAAGDDGPI